MIKEKGYYPFKENFKIGKKYFDDDETHDLRLLAKKISVPILIILADKDEVVDNKKTMEIYRLIDAPKKLLMLKNSSHLIFKNPSNEKRAIDASVEWFQKWLE